MKVVYSRRAVSDLDTIASCYSKNASPAIAQSIERRFIDVIERIPRRNRHRELPSVRWCGPYLSSAIHFGSSIEYAADTIDILRIRHTSRRPVAVDDRA
ncbi:type II toxin-antitoxin system RelE/ParE family toxin [Bradyrhizobium sp.]|uniref:type II toxin-antitoxin system RelE/ParE family toxin n=1 Tax=Bradyrhizobium sp. TaxID=376 RepID=UPI001D96E413|nr:type II toxin-antitoxin system RelE/ParE family toxin [Bradyrhizobium sp.]MBV8918933.1 type II toxin-antitoxin system RelE/ParE family toxin [Bradyrhizobium sp.]